MKRLLVLVGIPLALLVLFSAQQADDEDVAVVDVVAENPVELRSGVLARMTALGGVRVGESSSFTGTGSADLRFRIPTARLEDALVALDSLGGRVTDQRIDLGGSVDRARSVAQGLDEVQACLDRVAGLMGSGPAAAERLATCQSTVDTVSREVDGASVDVDESDLEVRIRPEDDANPIMVVAIVILLGAAAALTVMVWRSGRDRDLDLRETEFTGLDEDPFLRRN